jgi:hypothetical protein
MSRASSRSAITWPEHWQHIRSANTIESAFTTVRLRHGQEPWSSPPGDDAGDGLQDRRTGFSDVAETRGSPARRDGAEGVNFVSGIEEALAAWQVSKHNFGQFLPMTFILVLITRFSSYYIPGASLLCQILKYIPDLMLSLRLTRALRICRCCPAIRHGSFILVRITNQTSR